MNLKKTTGIAILTGMFGALVAFLIQRYGLSAALLGILCVAGIVAIIGIAVLLITDDE
jgi:predicted membrane protein